MKLKFNREKLGRFCRERGIARLELFGSALSENFRDDSDVDLLATLQSDARPTLLDWADMQEELAEMLGRPVDLVSRRAIEPSRTATANIPSFQRRRRFMRKDDAYLEDIHDYDDVDLDVVWETVQRDIPPLIARLEAYLTENPPPES